MHVMVRRSTSVVAASGRECMNCWLDEGVMMRTACHARVLLL
jgi:hypothetical protein